MTVNIKDIIFYGEYYSDDEIHNTWYFCLNDYKVYNENELKEQFSFETCGQIEQSGMYIELFKTDIVALEKEFIEFYNFKNNKKFRTILQEEEKYTTAFGRFIDHEHYDIWTTWYNFEKERLIKDAVEWCKKNGIPYVLN